MCASTLLREWQSGLATLLPPCVHAHQAKALADLSFALALAGQCQSGLLALALPTAAKAASTQRRCERFLANERIRPRILLWHLAKLWFAAWAGRPIRLLLDETPKANQLRVLKVSVAFRKRAIPLWNICYPPDDPPMPMPQLIPFVLRRVRACLPPDANVTLLADRGLAWPVLLDTCRELNWHFLFRLQGTTKVILPDGREVTARELVGHIGGRWEGKARLFKKAGWRTASVLAYWPYGREDPWLLVSDERPCAKRYATYGTRTWTEELFRDEKSQALNWQKSQVRDPKRVERLLLLMALAIWLAMVLGVRVLKRGLRRNLETGRRRGLSVVQLGLRWLRYVVHRGLPLGWPLILSLSPH